MCNVLSIIIQGSPTFHACFGVGHKTPWRREKVRYPPSHLAAAAALALAFTANVWCSGIQSKRLNETTKGRFAGNFP